MAEYTIVETKTIESNIKTLKEKESIGRIGADKNEQWIVINYLKTKKLFL